MVGLPRRGVLLQLHVLRLPTGCERLAAWLRLRLAEPIGILLPLVLPLALRLLAVWLRLLLAERIAIPLLCVLRGLPTPLLVALRMLWLLLAPLLVVL